MATLLKRMASSKQTQEVTAVIQFNFQRDSQASKGILQHLFEGALLSRVEHLVT